MTMRPWKFNKDGTPPKAGNNGLKIKNERIVRLDQILREDEAAMIQLARNRL
jgi:hypothetical protein